MGSSDEDTKFVEESLLKTSDPVCYACLTSGLNVMQNDQAKGLFIDIFKLEVDIQGVQTGICQSCLDKLNSAKQFFYQAQWSIQCLKDKLLVKNEDDAENYEITEENCDNISSDDKDDKPLLKLVAERKLARRKLEDKLIRKSTRKLRIIKTESLEKEIDNFKKQRLNPTNFNCIICKFKGVNRRHLGIHMTGKHNFSIKKNNYCSRCNKIVEDINIHNKVAHKEEWKCKFCKRKFNIRQFIGHLKRHADILFSCDTCPKKFLRQQALDHHQLRHTKDRAYVCPKCNKTYKYEHTLQEHIAMHSRYYCQDCGENFEIHELLITHVCALDSNKGLSDMEDSQNIKNVSKSEELKIESEENSDSISEAKQQETDKTTEINRRKIEQKLELTCSICQKSYKNKYTLQAHIKGHMDDYPVRCGYCNKGYTSKADLLIHESSHSKIKSFICSSCGKGYSTKGSLTTHMKTHGGRNEICEICKKTFCRKIDLKLHLQKHKGERPFLCPDCGMAFAQKSHLNSHLTIHSDLRPFACYLCEKKFKKKELLKHHITIHGEKSLKCPHCPYECHKQYRMQCHLKMHQGSAKIKSNPCQLCDRGFSNNRLLQHHMESVHKVVLDS